MAGSWFPALPITRSAAISADGQYRYVLARDWGSEHGKRVCWVMLNPSTADGETDDATIRRCIGFSKLWGYHGLDVVNLYAYRETHPALLWRAAREGRDIVGPLNDASIAQVAIETDLIVLAWGGVDAGAAARRLPSAQRATEVRELLGKLGIEPRCLGLTLNRQPRHPVRLPYDTALEVMS